MKYIILFLFFILLDVTFGLRISGHEQSRINVAKESSVTHFIGSDILLEQFATKSYDQCRCNDGSNLHLTPRKDFSVPTPSHQHDIILVTTSVGEHDKLEASLKCNKAFANKMIVLTSHDDKDTQRVCDKLGARCYATNAFHKNGDALNKGRALNELQRELHREATNNSVVMLIDSDICLPASFSEMLPSQMSHDVLFSGVERCMYETPEAYSRGWPAVQARWNLETMGFLQMYRAHSAAPLYPTDFPTAAGSDLKYAEYFKETKTLDLIVMHMGISPNSKNWNGSKERLYNWASATIPPEGACPCCAQKTEHCMMHLKQNMNTCEPM